MPPKKISKKNLKKSTKKKEVTESTSSESDNELETTSVEEENVSTENIALDSDSESDDCEVEKMIQDDMEYFNQDESSEIQQEESTNFLTGDSRITNPRLTRYEMVRIIGERTKQLTMGAKPLVKNFQDLSYEEIAIEELKHNMSPFKIKRPLPNKKIEVWNIDELDKKHLESFIYN